MGAPNNRAAFRLTFTDFIPDPKDPDCLRRAVTVSADRLTIADEDAIFWLGDVVINRFALSTIEAISAVKEPSRTSPIVPAELRLQYPNMGFPWTVEDDTKLLNLYREGNQDFEELGKEFGRQPSAIERRLGKLGLEQL
ncbi:hypothetical protein ACFWBX_27880 [Streptomyces sp. NPDC059991]|uniref:hypothetical protein n=1 Tax=Streptomyces sp. NPDC059991 TaxID=3347028 RepID=UPI00367E260C